MPVIAEKRRGSKRHAFVALAGGLVLLLISLPLALTVLPDGITLGHYTVSADFISDTSAPLGLWQSDDYKDYAWILVFNGGSGAYVFTIWPSP